MSKLRITDETGAIEQEARDFCRENPELMLIQSVLALRPNAAFQESCPACGWTQKQLEKEEKLGCPLCYSSLSLQVLDQKHMDHSSNQS